jgi:acyl dehydratase
MVIKIGTMEEAKALEGQEVGVSEWVDIDQKRIDEFASSTEDHQWIHVDPARAAEEMPGGKTIAHGYLTLGLVAGLTTGFVEWVGLERAINYGLNKVRFMQMVPEGSRVRARTVVKSMRKRAGALQCTCIHTIEIEGETKPACRAETIGLYFISGL